MSRPKRINLPFCLYHVLSRTNSESVAFHDMKDMWKFLSYLAKYQHLFDFRVHAWCLMPTHFHLLLESAAHADLSELMRRLLTAYTVYYNKRHKRHGHLFQGRFKSYVVEKSSYLLALSRYIHLNPVADKDKRNHDPATYPGSSLKYYLNGGEPPFLYTKEILSWFKGERKAYARFVMEGLNEDIKPQIIRQAYIGGKSFIQRMGMRANAQIKKKLKLGIADNKTDNIREMEEKQKARELLEEVAHYFHLSPELIRNSRHGLGHIGKARTILVTLLRETLTWTGGRIISFVGLRSWSAFSYHIRKAAETEYQKVISAIRKKMLKD